MSHFRIRFTLREMFFGVFIIALACLLVSLILNARHAAQLSSYGGQRMSRRQAEAIHRGPLPNIPDNEFRKTDNLEGPFPEFPQSGQP